MEKEEKEVTQSPTIPNVKQEKPLHRQAWFWILVSVAIITMIYGIKLVNPEQYDKMTGTKAPTQQVPQKPNPKGVSSNVTIEVVGITTSRSVGSLQAKGVFKTLHITVTNNQKDAIYVNDQSFKLYDDQDREFSHSTDVAFSLMFTNTKSFGYQQLNPGLTTDGYITFDIPSGAKGLKLQARGGVMGDPIFINLE